jgi:hypothetical protein
MKKKFYLAVLCILGGCVPDLKIPKDVVAKEQMISVLIDMHILEAQTGQLRIPKDSAQAVFEYFEAGIMARHEIIDSLYLKSLEFYYSNPALMEEIYAAVLDSLSLYERMSEGNKETQDANQPNQ